MRPRRIRRIFPGPIPVVILAGALAAACGDVADDTAESGPPDPPGPPSSEVASEYAPELDVDLSEMDRSETGLYSLRVTEGSGEPVEAGDTVVVHYTGWLPTGEQFDSSHDRGEPLEMPIGVGSVIRGWDEGVVGMRPGERKMLVIPPALGYGNRARGPIPAGATLVFDVELLEAR